MLYIEKQELSDELKRIIIEIRKSDAWKQIKEGDTTAIRYIFDNEFPKIAYKPDGTIFTEPEDKVMEKDINEILMLNGVRKADGSVRDTSTEVLKGRRDAYERAR